MLTTSELCRVRAEMRTARRWAAFVGQCLSEPCTPAELAKYCSEMRQALCVLELNREHLQAEERI